MAYSLNFVFDFGSLTGLTLNGKLYDHLGAQVGATITTGFVEIGNGVYTYLHSALPDGGRGVMVAYKSTDATIKVPCGYNPQTTENVVVISTTTMQAIADELLKRSVSNVEATASTHSLAEIILAMLESAAPSTTWTIRKTDGTTFNTRTLTEDATAKPVVGVT